MLSNISEKYRCEWVAPERTGSRKVAEVLTYFGFTNNNKPIYHYNNHFHLHNGPNEKYKDYILICNARNPYARTYSIFKNLYPQSIDKSKESFKKYLFEDMEKNITGPIVVKPIFTKIPDYLVRLEYMYEDLMKLPFILEVLNTSQLEMLCSHGKPIEDWEQFYDQETKDFVYSLTKHHFDVWGYEK